MKWKTNWLTQGGSASACNKSKSSLCAANEKAANETYQVYDHKRIFWARFSSRLYIGAAVPGACSWVDQTFVIMYLALNRMNGDWRYKSLGWSLSTGLAQKGCAGCETKSWSSMETTHTWTTFWRVRIYPDLKQPILFKRKAHLFLVQTE